MCGFAGYFSATEQTSLKTLNSMGEAIVHRGPDSGDTWHDNELNIGLVHQRLAIQDLSPHGNQPMTSKSQRYVIAFNGEIYNFNTIRKELEPFGHKFTGHSDTEVMLAAFEQWGLESALAKFAGMFAFALVDLQEKELILARDRMGEKPLYFGTHNNCWLFGSELKALKQHQAWQGEINRDALPLLLRHNFIPAPHTIYKNTYKLLPSTFVRISLENQKLIETKKYWSLPSELIAAFLWAQFDNAEEITQKRLSSWNYYHSQLSFLEEAEVLRRPIIPTYCEHNAHLYYILLPKSVSREKILRKMKLDGIGAVFHYVPLHSSPAGKKFTRYDGEMHNTDSLSERIIRLPLREKRSKKDASNYM